MTHTIGTREEWLTARRELLLREKELTRLSDEIAHERLALPWVRVAKDYEFDSEDGRKSLADLFAGNSQLIVYHFMFGPDWDAGCPSCSFYADESDGGAVHLRNKDISMVFVSRAPIEKISAYKRRMGWQMPWVSSFGSDFNFDYGVSFPEGHGKYNFRHEAKLHDELPGMSAFALQDGAVFHTYSMYARGMDILDNVNQLLDRAPLGRNEADGDDWVRRHDEYGT